MSATEYLKAQNQVDWDAATDHIFCRELADGSLPIAKMRWYLVQDYKFVVHFVRLLATALAHAPSVEDCAPGAAFLAMATSTENTYFRRCFAALDIDDAAINGPAAQVTTEFQNLMDEVRASGSYGRMLAVLNVAEWVYLSWGERYVGYSQDLPFCYAEWIDLHSGEGFAGVVSYLRAQLDQEWLKLSADEQAQVAADFARATACERAFFDAAYAA